MRNHSQISYPNEREEQRVWRWYWHQMRFVTATGWEVLRWREAGEVKKVAVEVERTRNKMYSGEVGVELGDLGCRQGPRKERSL